MIRLVFGAALFALACFGPVAAAELDGVVMPDTQDVAGVPLVLNGLALRTYSFLRLHIYVAGLYLEHRSADADAILGSNQPKLLRFVFQRHIDAEDARKAWREGFARNCPDPCQLPAGMTDRFLAGVPPVEKGDVGTLFFTEHGLDIYLNNQRLGQVSDPAFVHLILSVYIGAQPVTAAVKRGLLGLTK